MASPPKVRRRRMGGVAVASAGFVFWVVMAGTTVPTPLYPLYRAAFGFGPLAVTVLFAIYALGVVAGLLIFGRLSDQLGRRPVLLIALVLSAAAAVVFLRADTFVALMTGRVLSGLAAALVTGAATAALVELMPPARRGLAPIIALLANMGGLASGTLLAGVLAQWGEPVLRLPWIVHGSLVLVGLLGLLLVPETVARAGRVSFTVTRLRVPTEIRGAFLRSAMAGGAGFAVLGVLTATTGILLAGQLHLTSPALTGLVVFLAFACTSLGQLIIRRVPARVAMPSACGTLIVAAGLLAVAVLCSSLIALVCAAVLAGFGTGGAVGAGVGAISAGVAARHRGEAVSTYFAILYGMLAVPAIGVGVMIQVAGLRVAGSVFAAGVAALTATVLISLVRRKATT